MYEKELLQHLCKAMARPNVRQLRRKERALQAKVTKELERQKEFIIARSKKLVKSFSFKGIEGDVDKIFDDLDNSGLETVVITAASDAMKFGAKYRIQKMKLGQFGISFDVDHPLAVEYLKTERPLMLAKMADATKENLKPLLIQAAKDGLSPQELALQIENSFAFSPSRSLMIAVNEVGTAYEYGNWVPMKILQDDGNKVMKQWATVNDDRVTPECEANEAMGWIKLDDNFDSGDDTAPRESNPRCRCTTLYEIK